MNEPTTDAVEEAARQALRASGYASPDGIMIRALSAMIAAAVRAHHAEWVAKVDQLIADQQQRAEFEVGGVPFGPDGLPLPRGRCVAHGNERCAQCHLSRPGSLRTDGSCTGCDSFRDTGMHWDTCTNRAFEVYYGDDSARYRPELQLVRSAVRQVAYQLETLPAAFTLSDARPEHDCNAMLIVRRLYEKVAQLAEQLRTANQATPDDLAALSHAAALNELNHIYAAMDEYGFGGQRNAAAVRETLGQLTASLLSTQRRITAALALCDQGTEFGSVDYRDIRRTLTEPGDVG